MKNIRNFCIIAHIDHGKSTLADRLLEFTGTVPKREMREQLLDTMDLERERGITIKLQPVRMEYTPAQTYADYTRTVADNQAPTYADNTQTNADKLLYEDLTYKIRGAAFKVKKKIGLGHKETIYQKALEEEFGAAGLKFEKEKIIDVFYENKKVGTYRPDFVIENKIIVELKALPYIGIGEEKQIWTYLKGSDYKLLLLINFSSKDVEIKRIVYDLARESPRESAIGPRESAFILNLIDTPGHVDFNYEVSRSLAAVEGALLLVDATQGVQAQTLGNLYLALEQNLTVIPVVNKIDLPNAEVARTEAEIVNLLGCKKEDIIHASGKTGAGVPEILEAVIARVPPPVGEIGAPLRALIFDSKYDEFKGVVAYVRVIDGAIGRDEAVKMMASKAESEILEVGYFKPKMVSAAKITAGEIGYIATGLKNIEGCRVGDTIAAANLGAEVAPLQGYKEVKPMVFAGLFPKEGSNFERLREGIMKLKLNDAALSFEPESSAALGFGFRCGTLGLLHLEIIQERLRREYGMDLIVTVPSVAYKILKTDGAEIIVKSPAELPPQTQIEKIMEPWVKVDIITPKDFLGNIMALVTEKRGIYKNTEYLASGYGSDRALLHYELPLSGILVDFYDKLKSASSGYASLNYEIFDYREAAVERMDILVAEEPVEALSTIVYSDEAYRVGRKIVESLKESIPRQMFEVKIQAALGGKIVASERISAMKKDVLAKMSGGDWTRKAKLLKKQKKGKKKMMGKGHVDIPTEAFLAVLKR